MIFLIRALVKLVKRRREAQPQSPPDPTIRAGDLELHPAQRGQGQAEYRCSLNAAVLRQLIDALDDVTVQPDRAQSQRVRGCFNRALPDK